ncbi:galactokinase [Arthrobacter sp. Y-9]|uniref:galactokinase n=1 Tax=Arthrobacter sp. Y-9 TaxID=3039385 RepID=UPI00241DA354|nr:galactokinase [Arthrobacter sp. Y-9]WFR84825.1 galactokinase [Arthrobacter sp. Y-9]
MTSQHTEATSRQESGQQDILAAFLDAFGHDADGVWMAPGRVNLIGEHTDYNDGFVLPFAIDLKARVAVRALPESRTVRLLSAQGAGDTVEFDLDRITPGGDYGWASYPLGVAWALEQSGVPVPGFELYLDSTVPLGSGLSSSHAIECATITALAELSGASLSAQDLVLLTQRGENDFVGAPTGILDQSASLRGERGHAVFLDCRDQHAELIPFDAEADDLVMLVIDTRVAHSHSDGGYASRRASCEAGAAALGVPALRDLGLEDLPRAEELLDDLTFRRVRHVVTEDARVLETVAVLRSEGAKAIGPLLDASHISMRDDFEISCPELDVAVESARAAGAIGARMTGGGFGGSAIALTPRALEDQVRRAVLDAFASSGFGEPRLFTVTPAEGARRLA